MPRAFSLLVPVLFAFPLMAATSAPPPSDPQALALAARSLAALTGGTSVSDVTLTANVVWIAGSDKEIGTATLSAKGTSESRIDLVLSGGNTSEARSGSTAPFPSGGWIGKDGASHAAAVHNCWSDAVWFFPALSSLSVSDPSVVLNYVGTEMRGGVSVEHLRSNRYLKNIDAEIAATFYRLSTVDFYLDANSLLPVIVTFNTHPENDPGANIPIEIEFSSYQSIDGVLVPAHVQKYLQGGLVLDLTITGAVPNSGIPDANFNIQ